MFVIIFSFLCGAASVVVILDLLAGNKKSALIMALLCFFNGWKAIVTAVARGWL